MLDRKACKKMWVWNGNGPNPKDEQRVVFEIFPDGRCRAVCVEDLFYAYATDFSWDIYDHCEEITEPKYRAFRDSEMPEEWRDYWYRTKLGSCQYRPAKYFPIGGWQLCLHEGSLSNGDLFNNYEVQKTPGGEWDIVGVKE